MATLARLERQMKSKKEQAPPPLLDMSQAIKQAIAPEVAHQVREHLKNLPTQVREVVQQTTDERLSLLARKHTAQAFDELNSRQTQLERAHAAMPVPLGAPEVAAAARRAVAEATKKRRPQLTSDIQREVAYQIAQQPPPPAPLPPVASTPAPKDLTVLLQRDGAGRARSVSIGKTNFKIERDGQGRIVKMTQEE